MIGRRMYPFIVNGKPWKVREVSRQEILEGVAFVYVCEEGPLVYTEECPAPTMTKQVRFRIARIREWYLAMLWIGQLSSVDEYAKFRNYMTGFWLIDKTLDVDHGVLFWNRELEGAA